MAVTRKLETAFVTGATVSEAAARLIAPPSPSAHRRRVAVVSQLLLAASA